MRVEYTTQAKRIAFRYPLLTDIGIQVIYWVFALIFYFILVNFLAKGISSLFDPNAQVHMSENMIIAVIGGVTFGIVLGLIDFFIERKLVRRSLGVEVLSKFFLYTLAWLLVVNISRTVGLALEAKFIDEADISYTTKFYSNIAFSSSLYTTVMIMGITFIKQMNNKFGPGIVLPMLLGRYRKPRVEERIFMFMDLKSSTTYAEKLGHIKYSRMIQDCFHELNKVIPKNFAEIYQYVGDEVVLTWKKEEGIQNLNCLKFYFTFCDRLKNKKDYYENEFGLTPEFKASVHFGLITVAEVGDIKREIAYHGDTINTASRIQSMCNIYNSPILISDALKNEINDQNEFTFKFIDETVLKGKTEKIKLYSVEKSQ